MLSIAYLYSICINSKGTMDNKVEVDFQYSSDS